MDRWREEAEEQEQEQEDFNHLLGPVLTDDDMDDIDIDHDDDDDENGDGDWDGDEVEMHDKVMNMEAGTLGAASSASTSTLASRAMPAKESFSRLESGSDSTTKRVKRQRRLKQRQLLINAHAQKIKRTRALADNISNMVDSFRHSFQGRDTLEMNMFFEKLEYVTPWGVRVLSGVTGEIRHRRMTAVMGPGKTVFLNVLVGKLQRSGGSLKINGVLSEMSSYKSLVGFVPKEDIMLPEMTVRETLAYSARIRGPANWSSEEFDAHIDSVIKALNLSQVAHTPVNGSVVGRGLSVGQRRRVNIGIELAAAPLALFLDEPTSGLDSTSSMDVSDILNAISRIGLTVVAAIHMPRVEIFEKFDDVLLVTSSGKTAYFGPVEECKPYFETLGFVFDPASNIADVLMDIVVGRGDRIDDQPPLPAEEIARCWARHVVQLESINPIKIIEDTELKEALEDVSVLRGASFAAQVVCVHNRAFIQQFRRIGVFGAELFASAVAGLLLGIETGYSESYHGPLVTPYKTLSSSPNEWQIGLYGMFAGAFVVLVVSLPAVRSFGDEKAVYWREVSSGHDSFAYFLGKILNTLYRITLFAFHFTATFYILSRPPIPLGLQFSLVLLNMFCLYGVAEMISMMTRRENSVLISVFVGLMLSFLCGYSPTITNAKETHTSLLLALSPNRWAAETQFGLWLNYYKGVYDIETSAAVFGYKLDAVTFNFCIMLALGVLFRIITFVLMIALNREKQR